VNEIKFNGPPPNRKGKGSPGVLADLLDAVQEHPGEWAQLKCANPPQAHNRREALLSLCLRRKVLGVEVTTREAVVYARWTP
jgi:hypothetical protein